MKITRTSRGFEVILHQPYLDDRGGMMKRLVGQSSAIGDYEDALDKPGSSFLWIGDFFHLGREEVEELISHLQTWMDTGSLGYEEETR